MNDTHAPKARRPRGDGAVYQENGRWIGQLDLGRDATGKRRRRKVSGRTKSEVTKRMTELRREIDRGVDVSRRSPTVAEVATDWLSKAAPARRSEATMERLRRRIDQHLVPGVGHRRLDQLRVDDVEAWLQAEAERGQSIRTIQDYRSDLRQVLNWAQRRDLVVRNVAAIAELPAAKPTKEKRSLTEAQKARLLDALEGDRLGSYFTVIVELGLRPQELDALRWDSIAGDVVAIHSAMKRRENGDALGIGETKTAGSRRNLRLTVRAAAAMRRRRADQAAERLLAGRAWTDDDRWVDLAFTSEVGTPMSPSNVRRSFTKSVTRANVAISAANEELLAADPDATPESPIPADFTPYELRHTAASLLVDAGASAYAVADQLGHTTTRMLDRHYRHRVADVIDTAARIEERLGTHLGPSRGESADRAAAPVIALPLEQGERGGHGGTRTHDLHGVNVAL